MCFVERTTIPTAFHYPGHLRTTSCSPVKMNGVPLPPDHGFPARVIVPGIYGMKNVKWLTGLDLVPHDYKGYWQQQSWSDTALVKLSSRIDVPGDRELITTPRFTIKGIAFNGRNNIQNIEVSTDAGKTWKPGTLLPKLSPYTWTPWSYEWSILKSGGIHAHGPSHE